MSRGPAPHSEPPAGAVFHCEVMRDGDVGTVRAVGELDLEWVPTLSDAIEQLREAGCSRVVIDLRGLSFLDSSGLRLLIRCDAEAREDGHAIALIPGPPAVQRVFELTHTAEHLPFV